MNMMRLCVVLLTLLVAGGCSESSTSSESPPSRRPILYYFTWSDYVDPDVVAKFEATRGVRVVVDTFSSNEELLAKVQTGMTGYDVVVPSDFMAGIMGRLGLLAELDLEKIPHVQDLEPHLQQLAFDPTHQFAIPYLWGTAGIGYNADVVTEPPTSWGALWDPQFSGRISMLNDEREVFGVALRSLGYSLNSVDPQAIQEAKQKLILQKPGAGRSPGPCVSGRQFVMPFHKKGGRFGRIAWRY
jgi:spermidine/putrescine transport system substrate-binding protein